MGDTNTERVIRLGVPINCGLDLGMAMNAIRESLPKQGDKKIFMSRREYASVMETHKLLGEAIWDATSVLP